MKCLGPCKARFETNSITLGLHGIRVIVTYVFFFPNGFFVFLSLHC